MSTVAKYKIQVVCGGSCECSGKANVFIRKGVPIAEEPKEKPVKPEKPVKVEKAPKATKDDKKPAVKVRQSS